MTYHWTIVAGFIGGILGTFLAVPFAIAFGITNQEWLRWTGLWIWVASSASLALSLTAAKRAQKRLDQETPSE